MAKGPIITDEVKRIIAAVYDAHRDWPAKKVQFAVDKRLHGNGPKLNAVQKILVKIRKRDEYRTPELKGLDEPWSLASSSINPDYELPPEAIPIVLEAKRIKSRFIKGQLGVDLFSQTDYIRHELAQMQIPPALEAFFENLGKTKQPLSIREARWIARIYYVLKDRVTPEGIYYWARYYADYEKACELAGTTCNTADMDNALVTGDLYTYEYWLVLRVMSDDQQKVANDLEINFFGQRLKDSKFTPLGSILNNLWSGIILNCEKCPHPLTNEGLDILKRLQDWVLEQEPVEEFSYPEELLREVKYVNPFFNITR